MNSIRLTPGDMHVLRFVGRHRFATAPQVARLTGRTEKKIYPRLCGLRGHALVEFQRPLIERGVYLATRAGLAAAGLALPPARVDVATFAHDRIVAGLAVEWERAGQLVISEREMRSHDESPDSDGTSYGVTLPSGGRHYPDLMVATPSGSWRAVEVELTPKNRARRERILTGYARARHIEVVTYQVSRSAVAELLRRTVADLGISDLVEIESLHQEAAA